MKEVTANELKILKDKNDTSFQLIDVRELHEYQEANLSGLNIPMGEVMDKVELISKDKQVIIHCRSGKRSAAIIQALETQHGFTNLYNLQGGILAYLEL